MKIHRDNYEAYLLDKIEGRLSPKEEGDLELFLANNPDLEADFDIVNTELSAEGILFPFKDDLKKGANNCRITRKNFEQYCIARAEGDLTPEAAAELNVFLADNPDLSPRVKIYDHLKLKADKSIQFPDRNLLKKTGSIATVGSKGKLSQELHEKRAVKWFLTKQEIYYSVSIAASLAILLSLSILFKDNTGSGPDFPLTDNLEISPLNDIEPFTGAEPSIGEIAIEPLLSEEVVQEGSSITSQGESMASVINHDNYQSDRLQQDITDTHLIAFRSLHTDLQPLRPREPTSISTVHGSKVLEIAGITGSQNFALLENGKIKPLERINNITGFFSSDSDSRTVTSVLASVVDEERRQEQRITVWDIAEAGIKGINAIAGTELSLERKIDSEGEMVSMGVNLHVLEFQRTVRK